jgi:hypothetical protein
MGIAAASDLVSGLRAAPDKWMGATLAGMFLERRADRGGIPAALPRNH